MNKIRSVGGSSLKKCLKVPFLILFLIGAGTRTVSAQPFLFDIISTLNYIQDLLMHIGPILSAVLFIIAGVFFALGQLFPSHQRAGFHTTATDIIIGAIIVAVLSVAAGGLAVASTHLLSNLTINSTA
jgi:hypothetical protein